MDRYSPVAPAAVRVQILPIGQNERTRFLAVLRELHRVASIVKLSEVASDNEGFLSPKSNPDGYMFFNYTTSEPSEQQKQLAPYELFREPLLVIGLVDGLSSEARSPVEELKHAATYLRERHPRVVHRQILLLQEPDASDPPGLKDVVTVGKDGEVNGELLKAAMCKVAGRFLEEFATYARAMQASPSVQTPGQPGRALPGTVALRGKERNSGSGYVTPTQGNEMSSPVDNETTSSPPPRGFGSPPPATTFDQMQGTNGASDVLGRSDSNASRGGQRTSSQDRAAGRGLSKEKKKDRGKARVGIVVGHIHMMAGHWNEALKMLVEHTNKLRLLSDRLWHAKGLDGILVCMLLLSWAGMDFQIPSICYPPADRSSSGHMSRFSVTLPSDLRPAEGAQQVSVRRLSTSMPEMLKQILDLYRSEEGTLELPPMLVYDSTIRFCKLMAILFNANSELNQSVLASLVEDTTLAQVNRNATFRHTSLSKIAIDEILKTAQPTDEVGLSIDDRISILAGMATVYALLPMDRKKGMILQEIVKTTTSALDHARKLGAAEMGIHPAATLSADTSTDAILATLGESGGVNDIMRELAHVYGAEMNDVGNTADEQSSSGKMTPSYPGFGNAILQAGILKSIAGFCEASPDPVGVLKVASSILMSVNPYTAIDSIRHATRGTATREDQIRLATIIGRTIGVSKQMGLSGVQADYWDPFLVRGLHVPSPHPARVLIARSKIGLSAEIVQQTPGNPLLYDPNASRPGTATTKVRHTLIHNEPTRCIISLQNPFDVPVEVEAIQLVAKEEGSELKCDFQPTTVGPSCIQQVPLSVSPSQSGDVTIIGCRIKISGCREQLFPIISQPWSLTPSLLVKNQGLEARDADGAPNPDRNTFQTTEILATCAPSQPLLQVDEQSSSLSNLTLLDGQRASVKIPVRNISSIPADVFQYIGTAGALSISKDEEMQIAGGEVAVIEGDVLGKADTTEAKLVMSYASAEDGSDGGFARLLPVSLPMTVKASLDIQDINVTQCDGDDFTLSFNTINRCTEPLKYLCRFLLDRDQEDQDTPAEAPVISPAESAHIQLRVKRWKEDQGGPDISEQLLSRLSVQWRSCKGEARSGKMDLSYLKLTKHQLDIIRGPSLDIALELVDRDGSTLKPGEPIKAGFFITVRVKLVNRSTEPTQSLFLRLHLPTDDRRVGLIGVPTRILGVLPQKGTVTTDFALCLLASGRNEIGVMAKAMGEQMWSERTMVIKAA